MSSAREMFASGALRQLVAERNIRSIVFQLSPETAARQFAHRDAAKAVQALKIHGFQLGFVGSGRHESDHERGVLRLFDAVVLDPPPIQSVDKILGDLRVPSTQQLLLAEHGTAANGEVAATVEQCADRAAMLISAASLSESSDLLATVAKDVVGSEDCLDTSRRQFGQHRVSFKQVFYESPSSFALVNLKPIVPGHVLVVPKRSVDRFEKLGVDEVSDLWSTAQLVGKKIEQHYQATSLTFAVQDGAAAGQTVPHVHVHVIPRSAKDFERNDDIYTEIENHERTLHVDNETREARSDVDMATEADRLCALFN